MWHGRSLIDDSCCRHTMIILGQARVLTSIRSTRIAAVRRPQRIVVACTLAAIASGCAPSSAPTLTAGTAPIETGATASVPASQVVVDTAIVVQGTPTEVYSMVARGALGCWFAVNGPLKATHVFHADASPPSRGGRAEIVLHERDAPLSDQRGARAFYVGFASEGAGVRVGIAVIKVAPALAELMVRDVEVWAKGGAGCQAQALSPPQAAAPLQPAAKTKSSRSSGR
jgi:hypothetical protein